MGGKRSPEILPDAWEYNGGILLRRGTVGPRFESCSVFVTERSQPTLDSNRQNPNLFRPESVRSRPASGAPAQSSAPRRGGLRVAALTPCAQSPPAEFSDSLPILSLTCTATNQ